MKNSLFLLLVGSVAGAIAWVTVWQPRPQAEGGLVEDVRALQKQVADHGELLKRAPRAWAYVDTRTWPKGDLRLGCNIRLNEKNPRFYDIVFETPFKDSRYVALISSTGNDATFTSNAKESITVMPGKSIEFWVAIFHEDVP